MASYDGEQTAFELGGRSRSAFCDIVVIEAMSVGRCRSGAHATLA